MGKLGVTGAMKDTTKDVLKEADFLHTQMKSKTKAAREAATDEWRQLKMDSIQLRSIPEACCSTPSRTGTGNDKTYESLRDKCRVT